MKRLAMWARCALVAAGAILALPAAHAAEVDLEIVLAVDVSRSIDAAEFQLQRQAYAAAFRDPRVIHAIRSGPLRRIAVTLVDWAGFDFQAVAVDWAMVSDGETAAGFADAIQAAPRPFAGWTSISGAIDYCLRLFDRNEFVGTRRVIDISGDGINNSGRPSAEARDAAVAAGVTINGLTMQGGRPESIYPWASLEEFYIENVVGGLGAFVVTAKDVDDFQRAIVNKLIREVASPTTGSAPRLARF